MNTGRVTGTTNFVETNPLAINAQLLDARPAALHNQLLALPRPAGDGNGITKKIGAMAVVANLHDKRIVELPDGEIFNVITYGRT